MSSSAASQQGQVRLHKNAQKWTPDLWEAGWTALPNAIIENQRQLRLDAVDLNILLHICKHWWTLGNLPHPSKHAIATSMGVDDSTIRRHIAAMEKRGLIRRINRFDQTHGQMSNRYDLTGLIEAAMPYAKEALELKKKRREEDAVKRSRKPRLMPMDPAG